MLKKIILYGLLSIVYLSGSFFTYVKVKTMITQSYHQWTTNDRAGALATASLSYLGLGMIAFAEYIDEESRKPPEPASW